MEGGSNDRKRDSKRRENASMKIVSHGRPRFRPVLEQRTSTSKLGMVDVADVKGPVTVARCGELQFQVGWFHLICGPAATPLEDDVRLETPVDRQSEGLVAWRHGPFRIRRLGSTRHTLELPFCLRGS
jgi:hypothetical protein